LGVLFSVAAKTPFRILAWRMMKHNAPAKDEQDSALEIPSEEFMLMVSIHDKET
jgi:hypothetical protein